MPIPVDPPPGAVAWKYTDPTEEARWIFDEREAERIAHEDSSLIVWLTPEGVAGEPTGDQDS